MIYKIQCLDRNTLFLYILDDCTGVNEQNLGLKPLFTKLNLYIKVKKSIVNYATKEMNNFTNDIYNDKIEGDK